MDKPLLIYDGHCGFCLIWVNYWKILASGQIDFAASQDVRDQYPQIPEEEWSRSVQLVLPDGNVLRGAQAVFTSLAFAGHARWLLKLYRFALFAFASEAVYRLIAAHRDIFYWATRLTFGKRIVPASTARVEWLFIRLLGAVYLFAFASLSSQAIGLWGADGILPIHELLARATPGQAPSLFWWNSSDAFLLGACWLGIGLSILLLVGIGERLCLILLFILYLSFVSAGQDFLSFQWDYLLLETGFLAIFLGNSTVVIWLFRWLLFRLTFWSGLVKLLSGDATWRGLSALQFHYFTQPLPTPLAWYMNLLPTSLQTFSTVLVLVVELLIPPLFLGPRKWRQMAAACTVILQVLILLTGNYAFFNLLTISLCLLALDDLALARWRWPARRQRTSGWLAAGLAVVILILSAGTLSRSGGWLHRTLAPYGIVNSYGLFAVMTTTRREIVLEGSRDGSQWLPYEFRDKPGDVRRAPPWVAPHQPRLDWQMWFAALGSYEENPWLVMLAERLLTGSKPVAALLKTNPFGAIPPRYVRAVVYDYRFTGWQEGRSTGAWWRREPKGLYLPAIGLRSKALQQ